MTLLYLYFGVTGSGAVRSVGGGQQFPLSVLRVSKVRDPKKDFVYQSLNACNFLLRFLQFFPQLRTIDTRFPQILDLLLRLAPARRRIGELLLQSLVLFFKFFNLSRLFAKHFMNRFPVTSEGR